MEYALNDNTRLDGVLSQIPDLKKMKARIEVVGDFEDLKKVTDILKELSKQSFRYLESMS